LDGFLLIINNERKSIKLSSEVGQKAQVKIKFSDNTRSAQLDI